MVTTEAVQVPRTAVSASHLNRYACTHTHTYWHGDGLNLHNIFLLLISDYSIHIIIYVFVSKLLEFETSLCMYHLNIVFS